ncbi:LysR substrate-binding domain-containing protein [Flagellatimonas centrodinii]|uniref:LysR substrate-binding domain-containing protein n=1 Tax=Flagellatimonas centrodinii TaxID=2806210 RepID=UPI001FEE462B|nr:LysR substrate-binding domain-containing protein [Flagellatimonas centrodinii]ULQ46090.1 LysR substrate-binding domain-containing protein [Flagellatimonas centrodinii]
MQRRLPKLSTLDTFRVAAATGSFKAAAEILSLTPSAVSHQIRALEQDLGTALFERRVRQLSLTVAGRDYAAVLDRAFGLIADGTQAVRGQQAHQRLALTLGSFVADEWVLPHLAGFTTAHPEIDLRLDTAQKSRDLLREDVDVALRFGRGRWPGIDAVHLLDVYAVPVVSPTLYRGGSDLASLAALPRLQSTAVPDAWSQWAKAMNLTLPAAASEVWVDSYLALLQGAHRGVGVALGLRPLIDAWLADGRLITPWAGTPRPAAGYWLAHRPGELARPAISALLAWLQDILPHNR